MSFTRRAAPDPAWSELRSFRASLNAPVVVLDELPAGPAKAVIAELAGPGGMRVALAIRAERTGQAVFFASDDALREWQGARLELEAVLSFAESMGFLFDDDRMAAAPADAERCWQELVDASSPGGSSEPPEPEIWLEEVAETNAGIRPSVGLTKFRGRLPGAALGARPRGAAAAPRLAHFRIAAGGRRA